MKHFFISMMCLFSLTLLSSEKKPGSENCGPGDSGVYGDFGSRGRSLEVSKRDENERGRSRSRTPRSKKKKLVTSVRTGQHEITSEKKEKIRAIMNEKIQYMQDNDAEEKENINVED